MMSHFLCPLLLLQVFLTGGAVSLVKASESNNIIRCGYDNFCQATLKFISAVNETKIQLDALSGKQARDAEELRVNLNTSLASAVAVSNERLDKLAENVNDLRSEQLKDVGEMKAILNKSLASTYAISKQLEKHSADLLGHDDHLKSLVVQNVHKPQDCSDVRARGHSVSGVYRVYPGNNTRSMEMDVYCDFRIPGQSWLVFQRRKDGSVSFARAWNEYANGFGNLNGEFWLGNDKLSFITTNKRYMLRIELEDFTGQKRFAMYSTFSLGPSTDKYRMRIGTYSGDAGDSLTAYSNNMMFTTKDQDNDEYGKNCGQMYPGGWWSKHCYYANLNGDYYPGGIPDKDWRGICWYHWKGFRYSLKAAEMKITALY